MTPDEIMTSPTIFTIWPSNACTDSCQRTFSSLRPPINYTEKEIRRTVSFYERQMNRTRSNFCGTQSKGVRIRKWSKDLSTRGIHFSLDCTNCIFAPDAQRNELDVKKKVHASPVRFANGNARFLHFARG